MTIHMTIQGWERAERDDPFYMACLAGTTIIGIAFGASNRTPLGPLLGAMGGFVFGYAFCPYIAPALRDKLLKGFPLEVSELKQAADAMSKFAGVSDANSVLKLLYVVRTTPPNGQVCRDPRKVAQEILRS